MMWPIWNGPFAYGSAVVTNNVRDEVAGMRILCWDARREIANSSKRHVCAGRGDTGG